MGIEQGRNDARPPRRRGIRRVGATLALLLIGGGAWIGASSFAAATRMREAAARTRAGGLQWDHLDREQREILLRVEDPAFFSHRGIDLRTPGAGTTTITQGLAKLHCFERWRPGLLPKIRQSLCAVVIDASVPKEEQLALFLNEAYFGTVSERAIRGFPAASRTWFGKPFDQLTRDEYLTLVAMIIGPDAHDPVRHADRLAERKRRIERYLAGECVPHGAFDAWLEGCR